MSWFLFALLAPVVWGVTNILDKFVLSKLVKDASVPAVAFGIAGFISILFLYLFHGFQNVSVLVGCAALAGGIIYFIAEYYYFKATELEEISRVISLIYLDPLFTAILAAIFLNEIFSFSKYLGVIFLVLGAVLISYKSSHGFKFTRAVWFCIISALLFSVCNLINKRLLDFGDFWTIFALFRLGGSIALIPLIILKREVFSSFIKTKWSTIFVVVLNSLLTILGSFLFIIALSLGSATLTTALAASQPFFVLVLTVLIGSFYPHILKEESGKKIFWQKLFAVIIMFVGVILISP